MSTFAGFPNGRGGHTSLPDLFFSELLPLIDNLAELKVTLHIFWLLYHKKGAPRYVTLQELQRDGTLLHSLQGLGGVRPTCSRQISSGLPRSEGNQLSRGFFWNSAGASAVAFIEISKY